jgi:hypothetical protein
LEGDASPWYADDDVELDFEGQNNLTDTIFAGQSNSLIDPFHGADKSLVEKFKHHCNRGIEQDPLSEEMKTKIELLLMLQKARAPHYLYQDIWKWAQSAFDRQVSFNDAGTRESILNGLLQRYNLVDTLPSTTSISLPGSGETVEITIHHFLPQLYSLLTDPTLMHENNLLFWNDNPFGEPEAKRGGNHVMKDVIDGSVYREAYRTHVKVKGRDLLVPIILYIDKTHVDPTGRLCLEPVTFTLGIFKKEVRKDPMAWRPLGFIVNQSNLATYKSLQKAQDYHFVLSSILESLQKAQEEAGIAWSFKYHNKVYNVVMKVPILFVIGDTEGHDKLCGKYLNRVNSKQLCRYCDCPRDKTGRAYNQFQYTKASQIAKLVSKNQEDQLKSMSYHCLHNCFTKLTFCDPKLGINGATLAEVLHLVQHGIFLYFATALFGEKAVKKCAKKAKSGHAGPLNMQIFEARRKTGQVKTGLKGKRARKGKKGKPIPNQELSDESEEDSDDVDEEDVGVHKRKKAGRSKKGKQTPNQEFSDESEEDSDDSDDFDAVIPKRKRARKGKKGKPKANQDSSDESEEDSDDSEEKDVEATSDQDVESLDDKSYQSSSLFDHDDGPFKEFSVSSSSLQKCEQNGVFTNDVKVEPSSTTWPRIMVGIYVTRVIESLNVPILLLVLRPLVTKRRVKPPRKSMDMKKGVY